MIRVDGIVIRVVQTGESDRSIKILTSDRGVIDAYAKAAGRVKSKLQSSTALFSYCHFGLFERKSGYTVDEAEPIESFFGLSRSPEALTLGQYFCEISAELTPENVTDSQPLRLLLNSLYFLQTDKKDPRLLKAVFELRSAGEAGFAPELSGCRECGETHCDPMFFDPSGAELLCPAHAAGSGLFALRPAVLEAMRRVVDAPLNKIWSLSLDGDGLDELARISERYLLGCLGHGMRILDFYRSLVFTPPFTDGDGSK